MTDPPRPRNVNVFTFAHGIDMDALRCQRDDLRSIQNGEPPVDPDSVETVADVLDVMIRQGQGEISPCVVVLGSLHEGLVEIRGPFTNGEYAHAFAADDRACRKDHEWCVCGLEFAADPSDEIADTISERHARRDPSVGEYERTVFTRFLDKLKISEPEAGTVAYGLLLEAAALIERAHNGLLTAFDEVDSQCSEHDAGETADWNSQGVAGDVSMTLYEALWDNDAANTKEA